MTPLPRLARDANGILDENGVGQDRIVHFRDAPEAVRIGEVVVGEVIEALLARPLRPETD